MIASVVKQTFYSTQAWHHQTRKPDLVHIRYVLIFLLLYFSRGFFVYSPPPVHLYI
jgi:hypothetical protein